MGAGIRFCSVMVPVRMGNWRPTSEDSTRILKRVLEALPTLGKITPKGVSTLVAPELGEREPTGHLQGVLVWADMVLPPNALTTCRHDGNRPQAGALHHRFLAGRVWRFDFFPMEMGPPAIMPGSMSGVHYTLV